MPLEATEPRSGAGILLLSVLLGLTTLGSLLLVGVTIGDRQHKQAETSAERRALVSDAITYACTEIEKLKAGEREAAWQSYRELGRNLELLHLKRTREIERAALQQRQRKLIRYAGTPCPIKGQLP